NLRAGAGTSYTVLAVMPRGVTVTLTGKSANGFYQASWSGKTGWASGEYLKFSTTVPSNPAPQPTPDPTPPPTGSPLGSAVTTDSLNLRASASTSARVIAVMPAKSKVALTGRSQNDFLELSWNGQTGWAHKDYLAIDGTVQVPQTNAVATDDLNVRSGPATSYAVLTMIPNGGTVKLTGQSSNGFYGVNYNGYTGWAFSSYLKPSSTGTTPTPTPTQTPPPVQTPAPTPTQPPVPTQTPTPQPPANIDFDVTNTIIGPVRGTPEDTIAFARRAGAQRMDEVESYIREMYRLAPTLGFDPAILIAQSALETGYWKSDRWVIELNPAGLGITGNPGDIYDYFESGTNAARAQMAHMHAEVYGRSQELPAILQGVDRTYENVFQAGWAGTIVTIEDLSGTWAVDTSYHHKIVRVANEIYGK
ncbi:MAG TPA: SH3 domain-containing protein, partial [Thermomicrobiales bacterium]|nr:SH3 domain-containing protein [Thermomicrobiales bacterium]